MLRFVIARVLQAIYSPLCKLWFWSAHVFIGHIGFFRNVSIGFYQVGRFHFFLLAKILYGFIRVFRFSFFSSQSWVFTVLGICLASGFYACNFSVIAKVSALVKILSRWVWCSLSIKSIGVRWVRPTKRALDWRVRAAFFKPFLLAQASSVKMALSCPSRQPVTQAVRHLRKLWDTGFQKL